MKRSSLHKRVSKFMPKKFYEIDPLSQFKQLKDDTAYFARVVNYERKSVDEINQRSVRSPPKHRQPTRPPPRPMRREDIYSQMPNDSELVTTSLFVQSVS